MSPVNSRREMLTRASCGFGALALQAMLADTNRSTLRAAESQTSQLNKTSLLERPTMFAPRAKRIIFVFMQGGPSHVDSFDYKPDLIAKDGQSIDFTGVRFGDFGQSTKQKLMKPLWRFQRYGQTGKHVADQLKETTTTGMRFRFRSNERSGRIERPTSEISRMVFPIPC